MVSNDTIVEITNRDNGSVGYTIPDLGNLNRRFQPGETKRVTAEEVKKLSYIPGGQYLLDNCLLINNKELVKEIYNSVEPEYFYTENEIKKMLLESSIEEFLDFLDFAPQGAINLMQQLAVDLKVNDISKRDAILNKTGFSVTNAIQFNEETKETNEQETKTRRVQEPTNKTATPERRTVPSYKVVG